MENRLVLAVGLSELSNLRLMRSAFQGGIKGLGERCAWKVAREHARPIHRAKIQRKTVLRSWEEPLPFHIFSVSIAFLVLLDAAANAGLSHFDIPLKSTKGKMDSNP